MNLFPYFLKRFNSINGMELLINAGWIVLIILTTTFCFVNNTKSLFLVTDYFGIGGYSAFWIWNRYHTENKNSIERKMAALLALFIAPALILGLALCIVDIEKFASIKSFNEERAKLLHDPRGFQVMKDFAMKNYNVVLVLGNSDDSWAPTTLTIPGSSPAIMDVMSGFCLLSFNTDQVNTLGHPDGMTDFFYQGVMAHELGHCLDIKRDTPSFSDHKVNVFSIAPADAKSVHNLNDYLNSEKLKSTELWREAVADIFAIGYWRLIVPDNAQKQKLENSLLFDRISGLKKNKDVTHATMCWIKAAMAAPSPASTKDLFGWSDTLRSTAKCAIPE